MATTLDIRTISSLEKVRPQMVLTAPQYTKGSVLLNEVFSYQIAYKAIPLTYGQEFALDVESDLGDAVSLFNIRQVPVLLNRYWHEHDDNYISDAPGLFPDVLEPYTDFVMVSSRNFAAVWVSVKTDANTKPGEHTITIRFRNKDNNEIQGESIFTLEVIPAVLPKSDIPFTQWFHCDCLATYYNVPVFSEEHWNLIDNFMGMATAHGLNMILTPVITPALDTRVGFERPTVQLVEIAYGDGKYSFDFTALSRWLDLCRKNGMEYLEIAHLFTQWGAEHAPKIIVNGEKKFGWETDALSPEYKDFLSQFLPALTDYLRANWDNSKVYFHISDEPHAKHIDHYGELYHFVKPLLGAFKQMDAMSNYEMYKKGFIETPVVASSEINGFAENNVDCAWIYYCCGQGCLNLSNRFMAMPSYRNRIMGVQMYKYDSKGFLQWGYNFYYGKLSTHPINPYLVNDADGAFQAGDAFSVYPGPHGALPSLRLKVFLEAIQDLRALKLLESAVGKEEVLKLVESEGTVDIFHYPADSQYLLRLREAVNKKIRENL